MAAELRPAAEEGVGELLEAAPCGFLSFGDDGKVLLVNQTLLDLLGHSREDVVGRHVERLLSVATRIFYQTHWFPLLRLHGSAEEIFLLFRSRDGEDVGMLVNAGAREHGGATVYDCVLMRVRERQKYETELLEARRTAERALSDVQARERQLEEANEQLEAQALEMELQAVQLQEHTSALEATGEELRALNEELLDRNEEADALRQAAEEANRAKSTFLAVMSHELRTPLNAIAGYVQLLEMGIHGPVTEAQTEALGRIARSQRHLLRLINDVLNLARIEAGRVDYAIEEVDLAAAAAAVAPMVEPQMAEKGISFALEVPTWLVALADGEKVQQVLLNLLGNAAKFTETGGEVRVTGARDGGRVLVRVADTGIGIPPGKLESVFQPFLQVDVSRTRAAQGTGLGLAISRDLAQGMGGDLVAESAPGKGSTFTLALPAGEGGG
jgi:PAS domain S-box-containing protein